MTIRQRLTLSNLAVLTLLGCNVGFHSWGDSRRKAAFEDLRHAITRQTLIANIREELNACQKQIILLGQTPSEVSNRGARTEDVAQFNASVDAVTVQVAQLTDLAHGGGQRLDAFRVLYRQLSASWQVFYRTLGRNQSVAITEMVIRIEPLGNEAIEVMLPGLQKEEEDRVENASAHFYAVAVTVNQITMILFLISGILAGLVPYLVSRRVTRGLGILTLSAEALGSGRLDYRLSNEELRTAANSSDELGGLARSFNDMAGRVNSAHAELESRQKNLETLRAAADSANRAKSQFLANMSHELRTPMNAIIGYSELVIDEAAELGLEDAIADLRKISAAGKHLLALISDILDLSKIEAGRMELFPEVFDVAAMVADLATTIQPLVVINSNILTVDVASGTGVMYADLTKVRQSLLNLLSNACKFTNQGAIHLRVRQEKSAGRCWFLFEVRDSGIGMEKDRVARVFEAFTQADASTTRRYGGTGLGLTITRKFCEMMGGSVEANSEPGIGTTFTIRLPLEDVPVSMEPTIPMAEVDTKTVEESGSRCPMRGSVLVIDDDEAARQLMKAYLSREGYLVTLASDGEMGLEMVRRLRPDIITLDVMMPRVDGWNVLTTLKADPDLCTIPVIVISMVQDQSIAVSLGAREYLVKPVNRDQLISVLRKYQPLASMV